MDWGTVGALLLGTGISIGTTIATTYGAEVIRDHRAEKRRRTADQRVLIEKLQERVNAFGGAWALMVVRRDVAGRDNSTADETRKELVDSFALNVRHASLLASRIHDLRAANALHALGTPWKAVEQAKSPEDRRTADEAMATAIDKVVKELGAILREQ